MNIGVQCFDRKKRVQGRNYLSNIFYDCLATITSNVLKVQNDKPLEQYINDNKLDVVFTFETSKNFKVVQDIKERTSCRLIEVPMIDCIKQPYFSKGNYTVYDDILCVSQFTYDKFKEAGYDNLYLCRVGFRTIKPTIKEDSNIVFFHPGGWGGSLYRKNTLGTIRAFNAASKYRSDISLIFTSQWTKDQFLGYYPKEEAEEALYDIDNNDRIISHFGSLERYEFLRLYDQSDVLIYTSLKEGVGLCVYEAMRRGIPAIITNAPPLNEVVTKENGWLCHSSVKPAPKGSKLCVDLYYPDNIILTRIIANMQKEEVLKASKNAINTIDTICPWNNFQKQLQELLNM